MYDILVQNAKIVSPETTVAGDVAIKGEKIAAVLESGSGVAAQKIIDGAGNYLLPGLIDPHTHIEHMYKPGLYTKDDFFTASSSMAVGGVTSLIDFAIQQPEVAPLDILEKRLSQAEKSATDYSFHACFINGNDETLGQIGELVKRGISSLKIFMAYRSRGRQCDDGVVLAILEEAKKHGALVGAHTENGDIIDYLVAKALRNDQRSAIHHALTRPPYTEEECMRRAFFLAETAKAPFYDFHMSIGRGVDVVRRQRAVGRPVYAETLTHYLTLTKEVLNRPNGINFICSPPMRDQEDIELLWQGLADGTISTTASDHCSFDSELKKQGEDSFDKVPNGVCGAEFRLPLLFSEGVNKGRLSVNRFVAVTSANAARIFGMYPQKGVIAPGSDADMVLVDPDLEKTLSVSDSLIGLDWSTFDGIQVKGLPVLTLLRGKVGAEKGK
jgi:dihydropyrimidinase